jgi:hypothetical protein
MDKISSITSTGLQALRMSYFFYLIFASSFWSSLPYRCSGIQENSQHPHVLLACCFLYLPLAALPTILLACDKARTPLLSIIIPNVSIITQSHLTKRLLSLSPQFQRYYSNPIAHAVLQHLYTSFVFLYLCPALAFRSILLLAISYLTRFHQQHGILSGNLQGTLPPIAIRAPDLPQLR